MKEITRIHLAKVAYDIELDAKKDIQKYVSALERYADDQELLADIEIRITELLAERGIAAGGVISADDVAAVRAQLGEPSDFAPEGDIAIGQEELDESGRRLYRDTDGALFGGVLAGLAKFLGIDPLWVRLLFIVILFASFGTAIVVYLILWLVVPPARTAAEKLRMSGRPVTLASIKALGGDENTRSNETAQIIRRVLRGTVGIVLVLAGVGAILATTGVAGGLIWGTTDNSPFAAWRPTGSWWLMAALGLFILAGVLFAGLCFVLANATFRRAWSRRVSIAVISIITVGLLSFFGGLGTVWYGSWQDNVRFNELRQTSSVNLPAKFEDVKSLTVITNETYSGYVNVEYIVSTKLHYEIDSVPGVKPKVVISDNGTSATVEMKQAAQQTRFYPLFVQPTIRIYGPALQTVSMKGGMVHYYNADAQEKLEVIGDTGSFSLAGTYETVGVVSKDVADITLRDATIQNLDVTLTGGNISAGVVRTLSVQQPDACPANDGDNGQNRLAVQAVSSQKLLYNGAERKAETIRRDCGTVLVGSDDTETEYRG